MRAGHRDHRPGVGRGLGAAQKPDAHGKQVAVRWVRPGRPGGGPAARPRRPRRRGVRARRPHRRPVAVRHPRVRDGEGPARPAPRPDAGRGHDLQGVRRRRHRRHRRPAPGGVRRGRPRGRSAAWRDLPLRVARSRASTRRWSTCRGPTTCSRATSTRPITAEGKHVIIIGGGDTGADCWAPPTGRAPRRSRAGDHADAAGAPLPRACPGRRLPDGLPGLLGPRGGRQALLLGEHHQVRGGRRRRAGRRGSSRCPATTGRFVPVEGTERELPRAARAARDGLRRAEGKLLADLGMELDEHSNVARDRELHDQHRRRLLRHQRHGPRAEPHGVGDRGGQGGGGGRWTPTSPRPHMLPRPIGTTDRPITSCANVAMATFFAHDPVRRSTTGASCS